MTSSGKHVICAGYSSYVSVLDASSLETVKKIQLHDNWTSSLGLQPTDTKFIDRIFAMAFDGLLHSYAFDETKLHFERETQTKCGDRNGIPAFAMEVNGFDKNLVLVVQKKACGIYVTGRASLVLLVTFDCPSEGRYWAGGRFLSARTVLLHTATGRAYIYYLGPASDVSKGLVSTVPDGAVVLISDGKMAWFCPHLDVGAMNYVAYHTVTCISEFYNSKDEDAFMCPVLLSTSASSGKPHQLFSFQVPLNGKGTTVSCWRFWGSLFGADLKSACGGGQQQAESKAVQNMLRLTPANELSFLHGWKVSPSKTPKATCACLVMNKYLAIGRESGDIDIVLLSVPFTYGLSGTRGHEHLILHGHKGMVRCLFAPEPKDHAGKRLLVSGGVDCTVRIWNLDTSDCLGSYLLHTQSIDTFIPMSSEIGPKLKSCIVSVAKDHSIAIIDLDDLVCLYRFSGHSHPIRGIHWRTNDEIMVVECINGTAYVWQLKTGHLDRVESGSVVEDIISQCDSGVSVEDYSAGYRNANIKKTLTAYPVYSDPDGEYLPSKLKDWKKTNT
ncbi:hypothetical protein HK104_003245 [Borealophlyctis nickersoniae]|nr:hypothetical protein HK104_003245 [Borealophlyctis nickersoniae]